MQSLSNCMRNVPIEDDEIMVSFDVTSLYTNIPIIDTLNHSGHLPPFCRGVEPPTKFSKRGGLTEPQFLQGGCWEIGGDFFPGGLQLPHKK